MIILGNLLLGLATILDMILGIMVFIVIIRAIISWVNPDPYNAIVRFLNDSTEPFLRPLRRYIPLIQGRIDITPIVLLVFLYFLRTALVGILVDYGGKLRMMG